MAFIIDALRFIVGWQAPRSRRFGPTSPSTPWRWPIWRRRYLDGLLHHSDRGSKYLSIRYTERLAEAGAVPSVGSRGNSFGLYNTEIIRWRGPWKGLDDVEYGTLEWVDWFNHRRLFERRGFDGWPPPIDPIASERIKSRGHDI